MVKLDSVIYDIASGQIRKDYEPNLFFNKRITDFAAG